MMIWLCSPWFDFAWSRSSMKQLINHGYIFSECWE